MSEPKSRSECICLISYYIAIAIFILILAINHHEDQDDNPNPKSATNGSRSNKDSWIAAVAADSWECSVIGRDILQKGGSAVDAAIASLLCTSLIHPQSMGLGGGSIFTILDKNGKVRIFNGRETVPKNFDKDFLSNCSKGVKTEQAASKWIGVPGELRVYERVHQIYGNLNWSELFQPTLELYGRGVKLSNLTYKYLKKMNIKSLKLSDLFFNGDGKLLEVGDTVNFSALNKTLGIIAEEGANAFYSGQIARDLIEDIKDAGGTITLEDLSSFKVHETEVWNMSVGEYEMYFPPPPAGAPLVSLILGIMEGYGMTPPSHDEDNEHKVLRYHRFAEALKNANFFRNLIKDLNFYSVNDAEDAKMLRNKTFVKEIQEEIYVEKTHRYYLPKPWKHDGTSHLSVIAEDGTAVSVTSSINSPFGSRVYSPKTGIILNNQMEDFCSMPCLKKVSSGERPPSAMTPAIFKAKDKTIVIGGSGGHMITAAVSQSVMNHLWLGRNLRDAISDPRLFVDSENKLWLEDEFMDKEGFQRDMEARKHKFTSKTPRYKSVVNAVRREDRVVTAYSDKRKNGTAAGY